MKTSLVQRTWAAVAALLSGGAMLEPPEAAAAEVIEYKGMCNASAAVPIGDGLFVVADDEDKHPTLLRLYRTGDSKLLSEAKIHDHSLGLVHHDSREVDLEGAARIGERVYWIGSHSTDEHSKPQPNRRRLFATKLVLSGEKLTAEPIGDPYSTLIDDIDVADDYKDFKLAAAGTRDPKAPGGLSIEGIAGTDDGALLIAFRNPLIDDKALIAPLTNPVEATAGQKGVFAPPFLLDLGGRGVRDIVPRNGEYFIIAGPIDGGFDFRIYRWSGKRGDAPQDIPLGEPSPFAGMHPEALFFDEKGAYILSDDGKLQPNNAKCADLEAKDRRFRGVRINLP